MNMIKNPVNIGVQVPPPALEVQLQLTGIESQVYCVSSYFGLN
jgi:hypothetical protein